MYFATCPLYASTTTTVFVVDVQPSTTDFVNRDTLICHADFTTVYLPL